MRPWDELDALLRRRWDHPYAPNGLPISASAIDTGGHHTIQAYNFCKPRHRRRVWAIKGKGGAGLLAWPKRPSTNNEARVPLYTVGVDGLKDALYGRLQIEEPGPGYHHFPLERDAEYFDQLTAEERKYKLSHGHPVPYWHCPDGVRNEAHDCRVYGMAALHGWYSLGRTIRAQLDRLQVASDRLVDADDRRPTRRRWLSRRRHWLKDDRR